MEPLAEVVNTLGLDGVVVVLPRETGVEESARGQRLACSWLDVAVARAMQGLLTSLDDVEVLGVDVAMLGKVEVLLCDENALCGDRVSAYPCMQQSREFCVCAIAMARVRWGY